MVAALLVTAAFAAIAYAGFKVYERRQRFEEAIALQRANDRHVREGMLRAPRFCESCGLAVYGVTRDGKCTLGHDTEYLGLVAFKWPWKARDKKEREEWRKGREAWFKARAERSLTAELSAKAWLLSLERSQKRSQAARTTHGSTRSLKVSPPSEESIMDLCR